MLLVLDAVTNKPLFCTSQNIMDLEDSVQNAMAIGQNLKSNIWQNLDGFCA